MKTLLDNNRKHHSTSDWDFKDANWELTTFRKVSPPTAVRETINSIQPIICKYPGTTLIPQGEIRTWFWPIYKTGRNNWIFFRNQTIIGQPHTSRGYHIEFTRDGTTLFESYNASTDIIGIFPYVYPQYIWSHVRARFTVPTSGDHAGELAVELYVEEAGEWVQKGVTLYAPNNRYADSAINRLGIRLCYRSLADDTEIWKKG